MKSANKDVCTTIISEQPLKSVVMRALAVSVHQIHKVDLEIYSALITPFFKTGIRMTTTADPICHSCGVKIPNPMKSASRDARTTIISEQPLKRLCKNRRKVLKQIT